MDSYWCYMVWATDTRAQCITNTIAWFPSKIPMLTTSSIDYIKAGIANIVHALQCPLPNSPLAPLSDSQSKALQLLMLILHSTTNPNQPATYPDASLRVDEITPHKPAAKVGAPSVPAPHAPANSLQADDIMPFMPASIPAIPALANSPRVVDSMPFLPAPVPTKPPVPTAPAPSPSGTSP